MEIHFFYKYLRKLNLEAESSSYFTPQVYNHRWTQTLGKTIVNLLNVYTRISQTLPRNPGVPQTIEWFGIEELI